MLKTCRARIRENHVQEDVHYGHFPMTRFYPRSENSEGIASREFAHGPDNSRQNGWQDSLD